MLRIFLQAFYTCSFPYALLSTATLFHCFSSKSHIVEGRGVGGLLENKIKGWWLKMRPMALFPFSGLGDPCSVTIPA